MGRDVILPAERHFTEVGEHEYQRVRMARAEERSYVLHVNPIQSSAAGGNIGGPRVGLCLLVDSWEEESFVAPIHEREYLVRALRCPNWESIEAVGAADDPARFRIDPALAEAPEPCPLA